MYAAAGALELPFALTHHIKSPVSYSAEANTKRASLQHFALLYSLLVLEKVTK